MLFQWLCFVSIFSLLFLWILFDGCSSNSKIFLLFSKYKCRSLSLYLTCVCMRMRMRMYICIRVFIMPFQRVIWLLLIICFCQFFSSSIQNIIYEKNIVCLERTKKNRKYMFIYIYFDNFLTHQKKMAKFIASKRTHFCSHLKR